MSKRGDAVGRWRSIVQQQATSGLSVSAFCRQSGIAPASFYLWRRKLRIAANNTGRETSNFAERDAAMFTEVRIASAPAGDAGAAGDAADFSEGCVSPDSSATASTVVGNALELVLPRGHRILVRPGFDRVTLRALVDALDRSVADVVAREHSATDGATAEAAV